MVIFSPSSQSIDDWSEYGEISPLLLFKTVIIILISSLFFGCLIFKKEINE